jgi:hypothetical protein
MLSATRSFKVFKNCCKIATNFINNQEKIKMIKLTALMFIVVGLSACGKMGELEAVKAQAIDASTTQTTVAPELDILPHNSK